MSGALVPKLYNAWHCPYGQRVWMTLLYKNIPFQYIEQEPFSDEESWREISPDGETPVIVCKDQTIHKADQCMKYVDSTWKRPPHLPPDLSRAGSC